jgi:hypothetical protein
MAGTARKCIFSAMGIFSFYRLYFSLAAGAMCCLFAFRSIWIGLAAAAVSRTVWYLVERRIRKIRVDRWFEEHQAAFKERFGPYGIRLINRAESDPSIKNSLAEVFTPDLKKLKENVASLEVMDALFSAGMRPDGDAWQLHDLKLKYGKSRLEKTVSR